jgi:hypothetical protein
MKGAKLAAAAAVLTLALGQAFAAGSMDNIKAMDSDKDGMISKAEAMRMVEAKFDAMMKQKGVTKLTPQDVQKVIDDIAKAYGTAQ